MNQQELQDVVIRAVAGVDVLREQVGSLVARDKRAEHALGILRGRLADFLTSFHRDKYKSTDRRKAIHALAEEIRIFDKLGYDLAEVGAHFLFGVAALLGGRYQAAMDHIAEFVAQARPDDPNLANAHYLSGMISYNRRDFHRAAQHFDATFRLSPEAKRDWQSKTYVGELLFFLRQPQDQIEPVFREVEEGLRDTEGTPAHALLKANLYLKWGNCYMEALGLPPKERNPGANVTLAVSYYKRARKCLPKYPDPESLLPVVVDYSLAQALLLARSIDMELAMTPSELLADVFRRLRKIVLTRREEIILAQSYLLLGTCAVYSAHVSPAAGEIYLEYARTQTLNVPSDVCFFSCVTKELLSRDDFVQQIDFFSKQLEQFKERK